MKYTENTPFKAARLFMYLIIVAPLLSGCLPAMASDKDSSRRYMVTGSYPHDKNAQTEGLFFYKGFLYEGTGPCLDGPSSLRETDLTTGEVFRRLELPEPIFGEGVTIFNGRIIQLTYRAKTGYVYDLAGFKHIGEFHYDTEGWGLTHDEENLIMSDGTAVLYFLDPVTFKKVKDLKVTDRNGAVRGINELEYIDGHIYANIFLTPYIVRIETQTGKVIERIDLSKILKGYFVWSHHEEPANGIAWDQETRSMYVTGKYWPKVFRIRME